MENHPSVGSRSVRRLLLRLGTALIAGGTPVYEVEEEVARVGRSLGYRHVQVGAMPTGIHISLSSGDASAYERVAGGLRLDQLSAVNDVRRELIAGRMVIGRALSELQEIPMQTARYPWWARWLGFVAVATGICFIIQPDWPNVALAALLGILVAAVTDLMRRHPSIVALLPTLAAFAASYVAFAAAGHGLIVGPLRTMICSIAILLPGATLATAFAELAAGAMIAGASRLVYGFMQLLLFALGVALGAGVAGADLVTLGNVPVAGRVGPLGAPLGLVLIAIGTVLTESLPRRLAPWAFGLLSLTYVAQLLTQLAHVGSYASFAGATVASFGAAVIALASPRVPRLVIFLPSFWLLVPGTLGVISLTTIGSGHASISAALLPVIGSMLAISLGLVVGSAASRPLPRMARTVVKRRKLRARREAQAAATDVAPPGA